MISLHFVLLGGLVEASTEAHDSHNSKLNDEEDESAPGDPVDQIEFVDTLLDIVLNRFNVKLRLSISTLIDNVHLFDVCLGGFEIISMLASSACNPRSPYTESHATWNEHDIEHPLESLGWRIFLQPYKVG